MRGPVRQRAALPGLRPGLAVSQGGVSRVRAAGHQCHDLRRVPAPSAAFQHHDRAPGLCVSCRSPAARHEIPGPAGTRGVGRGGARRGGSSRARRARRSTSARIASLHFRSPQRVNASAASTRRTRSPATLRGASARRSPTRSPGPAPGFRKQCFRGPRVRATFAASSRAVRTSAVPASRWSTT